MKFTRLFFYLFSMNLREMFIECWQKHVIHVNQPIPFLLPIAADLSGQMFFMEYELRPLHIKADQSLKMTVRPVEIFYDQVLLLVSYLQK